MKKTAARGNNGMAYHDEDDWRETISTILNEFDNIATGSMISPIETSYEIS